MEAKEKIRLLEGHLSERDIAIINKALDDAKREGIKEVVEWLNKNDWGRVKGQDWQAKLKEWGIE